MMLLTKINKIMERHQDSVDRAYLHIANEQCKQKQSVTGKDDYKE